MLKLFITKKSFEYRLIGLHAISIAILLSKNEVVFFLQIITSLAYCNSDPIHITIQYVLDTLYVKSANPLDFASTH